MYEYCKECGKKKGEKRRGSKFCSNDCKNKHNYRLRKEGLKGTPGKINPLELSLAGTIEPEPKPEEQEREESQPKIIKFKEPSVDAELFNDILNNTVIDVGSNDPEQEDENSAELFSGFQEPEKPLPPQYIEKEVQIPSIAYIFHKSKHDELLSQKSKLENELKKLQVNLAYHQKRNGNEFILTGGLIGGTAGLISASSGKNIIDSPKDTPALNDKRRKKAKQAPIAKEPGFWERLFDLTVKTGIGLAAGHLVKNVTEDWREKDKKEQIEKINAKINEITGAYQDLKASIARTEIILLKTPEYLTGKQQVLNPDYEKASVALNGLPGTQNNNGNDKGNNNTQSIENYKQKEPVKFKSNKILKATDLGKIMYKALNFKGLWKEFFGQPAVNFHCLIHGNSGEGKSTFCVWFARYLAQNFGRVLYVSGEEGVNMTFHDKLKYCEAKVDNFYVLDVRTGDDFMQEVGQNEFHFIILDSLNDMGIDKEKLKEIFEKYKNSAFICIDQNNKKGDLLGAGEKKYIVDIVVNVKNYIAETTKNRFKMKGMIFKTEDFTNSDSLKNNSRFKGRGKDKDDDNGYNLDSDRTNVV